MKSPHKAMATYNSISTSSDKMSDSEPPTAPVQIPPQNMLPSNHGAKEKMLMIRVVDDNKKCQKDYKCNLKLIMKHMKYLETKIDPSTKESEL